MWEVSTFVLRMTLYLSLSGVAGGISTLLIINKKSAIFAQVKRYLLLSIFGLMFSTGLFFALRVGAFAEDGWAGMFDPLMNSIVYSSGLGSALNFRIVAVLFAALFYWLCLLDCAVNKPLNIVKWGLMISTFICIGLSFAYTGHVSTQGVIEKIILLTHILLAFVWLGALYPLWLATKSLARSTAHQILHRFGTYASMGVATLIVAGTGLAYIISQFKWQTFTTFWGNWLMVKLAFVGIILLIAAWHKWHLVPKFQLHPIQNKMQRSITFEILIGMAVLSSTSVLSTLVSP